MKEGQEAPRRIQGHLRVPALPNKLTESAKELQGTACRNGCTNNHSSAKCSYWLLQEWHLLSPGSRQGPSKLQHYAAGSCCIQQAPSAPSPICPPAAVAKVGSKVSYFLTMARTYTSGPCLSYDHRFRTGWSRHFGFHSLRGTPGAPSDGISDSHNRSAHYYPHGT